MFDLPLIFHIDRTEAGLLRLGSLLLGLAIVVRTIIWATQVMMIRGLEPPPLARFIFRICRDLLLVTGKLFRDRKKRRRYWSLYMPFSLISILFVSMMFATIGFIFIIYGVSDLSLHGSLWGSVSSMSTLGFANQPARTPTALIFALEGLTTTFFVGVLIVYVNSVYDDFDSRRDKLRKMDSQVDRATTGPQLLENAAYIGGVDRLTPIFGDWAADFIQLQENHRTLEGYLTMFALNTERHWVVDAPIVLDAANLRNTLVHLPPDAQAARCLVRGPKSIDKAVDHFKDKVFGDHRNGHIAQVSRSDFDQAADYLALVGIPIADNRDTAWEAFKTNRATYEPGLAAMAGMLDYEPQEWS